MRIANLDNRLVLLRGDIALDVENLSGGRFEASPQAVYERWDEFLTWAADADIPKDGVPFDAARLGPPTPAPRQVIAVGLNYRDHAAETGFGIPDDLPPVFTKFVSAITGPNVTVALPEGHVDWEVELAVVMGKAASNIHEDRAWAHVAGLTVAQDLSERILQMSGPAPQFSLGKSHPGFLPLGPSLVTIDEFPDPDSLRLTSSLNGDMVQDGTTADLIFPVSQLIARLSQIIELYPGDIILTGTPAGVGMGRTPPRYLHGGDVLVSSIEHIGQMRQTFVAQG